MIRYVSDHYHFTQFKDKIYLVFQMIFVSGLLSEETQRGFDRPLLVEVKWKQSMELVK